MAAIFPYPVTPQNLFRGQFVPGDGNVQGPYLSQFLMQPTFMGVQPMTQQIAAIPVRQRRWGGLHDRSSPSTWRLQNGMFPPSSACSLIRSSASSGWAATWRRTPTWTRFIRHTSSPAWCCAEIGCSGEPRQSLHRLADRAWLRHLWHQAGGPVDAIGTIPEMATRALKAAWFHKWIVNLRMRPEEYGALVHADLTHSIPSRRRPERFIPTC